MPYYNQNIGGSSSFAHDDFTKAHPKLAVFLIFFIIGLPFIWWFVIYRLFPNGMFDYLLWKIKYKKKLKTHQYELLLNSAFSWYEQLEDVHKKRCINKLDYLHRKTSFIVDAEINWQNKNEVFILAHFVRLILYYPRFNYFGLKQIVILPGDFRLKNYGLNPIMGITKKTGEVIISWESTMESIANPHDGFNLLYHQAARAFVHNIDHHRNNYKKIINRINLFYNEIPDMQSAVLKNKNSLYPEHVIEKEDLFFANSIELFFEKNTELRQNHPSVYQKVRHVLNIPD